MTASHPDFPRFQRRMKALGHYDGSIDGQWGPIMSAGLDEMLTLMERARDDLEPFDEATGGQDLLSEEFAELPSSYKWIREIGYIPKHMRAALNLLGVYEKPGRANNPQIMAWAEECREAGLNVAGYTADSVPWCGLFVAYVMLAAGRKSVDAPLWALNWSRYGEDGGQPEFGDILTFKRNGGGHVGFYVAEDQLYYHVLGGNQSDKVNIMRIAKSRMHNCRQPPYRNKPASARPFVVSARGAVSRNEA